MILHDSTTHEGTTYAVIEAHAPSVGVMNVGDMVCVRIVSMPQGTEYKSARTKGVIEHQKHVLFKRGVRYLPMLEGMKQAMHTIATMKQTEKE